MQNLAGDIARQLQSCHRRREADRAGLFAVWRLGVGWLLRIEHWQTFAHAGLAQPQPHSTRQRADGGFTDVSDLERMRAELVSCAHGRDDALTVLQMPEREGHLRLHVVDAIDGEIAVCEIIRQRFRQEPLSVGVDDERWVDLSEALSHDLDLEAADGACEGVHLAVQIRRRDAVKIHEREFADPGARQRFCCPGANAADTEHDDMRPSEFGDGVGRRSVLS